MNISHIILNHWTERSDVPLQIGKDSFTGNELAQAVEKRAATLESLVLPGQAVILSNCGSVEFWINLLAIWKRGAVAVPIAGDCPSTHLSKVEARVDPSVRLEGKRIHGVLGAAYSKGPTGRAMILFTSGSTGEPKGVTLSHSGIWANAVSTFRRVGLNSHHRLFVGVPFHFISSISHFLVSQLAGARFISASHPGMPGAFLKEYLATGANAFGGPPVQLRWLQQALDFEDLPLEWAMSSGDHLAQEIITRLLAKKPELRLNVVYGLTELSGRFCIRDAREGSGVGKPIEGLRLRIVDEQGQSVPAGGVGEVQAFGRMISGPYLDSLPNQHHFRTGDLGYLDSEGDLILVGRKDDIFKCMGLKVSTVKIEEALMATHLFEDVCVRPKPHSVMGHVPAVYYVAKREVSIQPSEVNRRLRTTLPLNQLPQSYTAVETIPRTATGKVKRSAFADT